MFDINESIVKSNLSIICYLDSSSEHRINQRGKKTNKNLLQKTAMSDVFYREHILLVRLGTNLYMWCSSS